MLHANHLDHHIVRHLQHGARWNDPFPLGMNFDRDFDDWTVWRLCSAFPSVNVLPTWDWTRCCRSLVKAAWRNMSHPVNPSGRSTFSLWTSRKAWWKSVTYSRRDWLGFRWPLKKKVSNTDPSSTLSSYFHVESKRLSNTSRPFFASS